MRRPLGSLESAVMEFLWHEPEAKSVREVVEGLPERKHAYTTIATVLENLRGKQWVNRELAGRIWFYAPTISASENAAMRMADAFSTSDSPRATLLKFVDDIGEDEAKLLRELLEAPPADKEP